MQISSDFLAQCTSNYTAYEHYGDLQAGLSGVTQSGDYTTDTGFVLKDFHPTSILLNLPVST